jgi:hypothetical protein
MFEFTATASLVVVPLPPADIKEVVPQDRKRVVRWREVSPLEED